MKPLVSLIDDALPARDFGRLLRAMKLLGSERIRSGYQTSFWFPLGSPPSNLVEEAVLSLKKRVPGASRCKGVEWWLSRMRTSNVKVDFHRDRDNGLAARTGKQVHPSVSSLLYLNRCRGGLLAVTTQPPNPRNQAFAPDLHDFDFVEPAPNRFCFFRGCLTHGVLDAKNQIPGARLPRERSLRLAIAINFWHERPQGVPEFSQKRHYWSLK